MMFDIVQNRLVDDDIIFDTSLDNKYIDQFISAIPNTSFEKIQQPYRQSKYHGGSTAIGRQHAKNHPSSCQCFKSTCTNHPLYDRIMEIVSFSLTLPILTVFTMIALLDTAKRRWWDLKRHDSNQNPMDRQHLQDLNLDEEIAQDEFYYARRWGYDCHQYNVTTQDGYILKMYRFAQKRKIPYSAGFSEPRKSVLIGHGLFQCSGNLVLNEKDSLVFALVDEGYDVWTGNNCAVGSLEHTCLSSNDASYWDWGLKELALYDFPAMLDYIYEATGQEKVGYIGHSQGNAQVFIALSIKPELANKMSCFIALAPAVVSGTLVTTYPLRALIHMNKTVFRLLFGKKAFLEIMTTAQRHLPPSLMCTLAYSVFSYLFTWWDYHWVQRRKIKYFQFTPRPVSTRLLLDWLEGWGRQGVCLHVTRTGSITSDQCNNIKKIPLAIIYGENDYLVDSVAFVRSFQGYENHGLLEEPNHHQQHTLPRSSTSTENQHSFSFPSLELVHVERIPAYEHMDPIWAHDSRFTTNPIIYDVLKTAKWGKPTNLR
ncbi:unnamed protein product [Absidia cylindrospora]